VRSRIALVVAAALLAAVSVVHADDWLTQSQTGETGFHPEVPISALGRAAAWLDPSRLHFSTSLSLGTGVGGISGLQVTSMSYQFKAPVFLNVSMGNSFGAGSLSNGGKPFLEGVDFGYRPMPSMMIRVQYRDFRSQLQNPYFGNPYLGPWGY